MTNDFFQTPPPPPIQTPAQVTPPATGTTPPASPNVLPASDKTTGRQESKNGNFASDFGLPQSILTTKSVLGILGGTLLLGILLGTFLFGGSSGSAQDNGRNRSSLKGLVANTDITKPLERCGRSDNTSPCTLYIMNHTRIDQTADYFFESASQLTGRLKQWIELDNQSYRKKRIPPGYFAEIKIPSRR